MALNDEDMTTTGGSGTNDSARSVAGDGTPDILHGVDDLRGGDDDGGRHNLDTIADVTSDISQGGDDGGGDNLDTVAGDGTPDISHGVEGAG